MSSTGQRTTYRSCVPVVDARFDEDDGQPLTGAIIGALAEAEGVDATDVDPLYDTVDLDALRQLFEARDGSSDAKALFSFTVDTWNVFVRADGRIRVCDGTRVVDPQPVFRDIDG